MCVCVCVLHTIHYFGLFGTGPNARIPAESFAPKAPGGERISAAAAFDKIPINELFD